jgi:hypothetical protein
MGVHKVCFLVEMLKACLVHPQAEMETCLMFLWDPLNHVIIVLAGEVTRRRGSTDDRRITVKEQLGTVAGSDVRQVSRKKRKSTGT